MSSESSSSNSSNFPYPPIWQDEARVQVLLAPFRDRNVNPENYDSKMKFWKDVIVDYCFFKGRASFCKQELQQTFAKGQRVPSCLDAVIEEMQRLGLLRLRTDFEYDPSNSWTGWAVNKFWKSPLNKIKTVLSISNLAAKVEFVHLVVLKKHCSDLQQIFEQPPYAGSLHCYGELKHKVCALVKLSEEGLNMCLLMLHCQRKIGLCYATDPNENNNRIHLVKIPSTSNSSVTIAEGDKAMHNLLATKESLLKQLQDLELNITENEDKARQCIRNNKRFLAKTYLRKKHLLEKNHEKRSIALHNIETLISNVDDAKHNGVILEAYRYGSKALQEALQTSNLTYDNVEEVVNDIRETMDINSDLQDAIGKINLDESTSNDEDQLERELRELMGVASDMDSANTNDVPQNTNWSQSVPQKVEISDAELLAMLEGLEVEHKTPGKNTSTRGVEF